MLTRLIIKNPSLTNLKISQSSPVPSITHVDYSARVQTVSEIQNPDFYQLISEFHQRTDCPMLINTSFNVRGEPIVCTPEDAFSCFVNTNMDVLVINNFILYKRSQPDYYRNIQNKKVFTPD